MARGDVVIIELPASESSEDRTAISPGQQARQVRRVIQAFANHALCICEMLGASAQNASPRLHIYRNDFLPTQLQFERDAISHIIRVTFVCQIQSHKKMPYSTNGT